MSCYHPWTAFQRLEGGPLSMVERADMRQITLPCGQCVGCRLARSRHWATRCLHEAKMHELSCFVTLTYNDEHLPFGPSLKYSDFQLFMKRLRARFRKLKIRFYVSGEYGEKDGRPHYHALLFGVDFPDRRYWRTSETGFRLDRSAILESLWPFGFCEIGEVSFESAAYCARYIMKKITGGSVVDPDSLMSVYCEVVSKLVKLKFYERLFPETGEVVQLEPEFNHMSLKPGIGLPWLKKFGSDVYPYGKVLVNGVHVNPPKYYDRYFRDIDPDAFDDILFRRDVASRSRFDDNTDERLRVKEKIATRRVGMLKRGLN